MSRALTFLISLYQLALSPYFGRSCRFAPTCSEYARLAIERHGTLTGCMLAMKRLARCHPFCKGGYDPLP